MNDQNPKDDPPQTRWQRWYRKVKTDPARLDRLRASWRKNSASYKAKQDADPIARTQHLKARQQARDRTREQAPTPPKRKPREWTQEQREKAKKWQREYNQLPEVKAKRKAYKEARKQDPEYRKCRNQKLRELRRRRELQDPAAREKRLAYLREYNKTYVRKQAQQDAQPEQEHPHGDA